MCNDCMTPYQALEILEKRLLECSSCSRLMNGSTKGFISLEIYCTTRRRYCKSSGLGSCLSIILVTCYFETGLQLEIFAGVARLLRFGEIRPF